MPTDIDLEEGDIGSFSTKHLGMELSPKMCSDQPLAFKVVNNSQAFNVGRKNPSFVSERVTSRCSKA